MAIRRGVVFHQDNARPHTSVVTRQNLWKLHWPALSSKSDISCYPFAKTFAPIARTEHRLPPFADRCPHRAHLPQTETILPLKPESYLPKRQQKVASDRGETALLRCLAIGAPIVKFSWSNSSGSNISESPSSIKYSTRTSQIDTVTWENVLYINNVIEEDFGYYTCTGSNEMGSDSIQVMLKRRAFVMNTLGSAIVFPNPLRDHSGGKNWLAAGMKSTVKGLLNCLLSSMPSRCATPVWL
ncbi:hypothetical protein TNCV_3565711 [Trichonephila clavipes]|nr:hypothetical protein TNCV_3565711 [Trichonephila clavipes]